MTHPFRVIDTGLGDGRWNIAFDQALVELHRAGRIPDTIRFLRFRPTALIGRHQALAQEVNLEWCRANGLQTARRITGGGALYMGPRQLGWELVCHRRTFAIPALEDVARRFCEAAAHGLQRLGLPARFRPRNDIEVEGRKIGGTGGFFDGDTLFYQGTLLIESDHETMLQALNLPAAKLARHGAGTFAERLTSVAGLLGDAVPPLETIRETLLQGFAEALDLDLRREAPAPAEVALARELAAAEIGTEAFVDSVVPPRGPDTATATRQTPGGSVTVHLRLGGAGSDRIREALVTGDFFVMPPRVILDLEAALRGAHATEAGLVAERFLAGALIGALSLARQDLAAVVAAAAAACPGAAGRTGAG